MNKRVVFYGIALFILAAYATNPFNLASAQAITGFSKAQGSMIKKKIDGSASGSACGQYLRDEGLIQGINGLGGPNEKTVAIGIAKVSAGLEDPAYVDSRYVAFREAWLNGNRDMARQLESQISVDASASVKAGQKPERKPTANETVQQTQREIAKIDSENAKIRAGDGVVSKGRKYLKALLDRELKTLGHDPEAAKLAALETNAAKKNALLAKAAAAAEAAKKLTGEKRFQEVIKATAKERMKGLYTLFANEQLSPSGDATHICVVLQYSRRSEKLADMMASRDFSNAPQLNPNTSLYDQLPDPSTPEGLFEFVNMWGLSILIDENGDVNLVAYGQAGYPEGASIQQLAAKGEAKLRAEGLIRLFVNQAVSVNQAAATAQNEKEFVDRSKKTEFNKSFFEEVEQGAGFAPINGMKELIAWDAVHPVTNGGIAGSLVIWNASQAGGAIRSKLQQNKIVKDQGIPQAGANSSLGLTEGTGAQKPKLRKGGLSGSTKGTSF
jgi:hypothetical protein